MKKKYYWIVGIVVIIIFIIFLWQRNQTIINECDSNYLYCLSDSDCLCNCGVESKLCSSDALVKACEYDICFEETNLLNGTLKCLDNTCILIKDEKFDPINPPERTTYCSYDSDCVMAGAIGKGPNYGSTSCGCINKEYEDRFDECQLAIGMEVNTYCECIIKDANKKCEKVSERAE